MNSTESMSFGTRRPELKTKMRSGETSNWQHYRFSDRADKPLLWVIMDLSSSDSQTPTKCFPLEMKPEELINWHLTDLCLHQATEAHCSIRSDFPHYVYINIVYYAAIFMSSKRGGSAEIKYLVFIFTVAKGSRMNHKYRNRCQIK